MNGMPRWLELLWQERRGVNSPTLREIANWTSIPQTTLSRYFTGKTLPKQEDLDLLLKAFEVDAVTRTTIVDLVRAARIEQRRTAGKAKKTAPQPPAGDLAALTEAITELNALMREFLQEQRRSPK